MKAIVENDIIISITAQGDREIGRFPKGIGRERLRFDGQKVVDLADLDEMWVKPIGPDFFELHAVKVSGSQKVTMTYADRKNLVMEDGIIRVKTSAEIQAEALGEKKQILKNRLRSDLKKDIGDPKDNIADLYKLITILIDYVLTGDSYSENFLKNLILGLRTAYPSEPAVESNLINRANILMDRMTVYYTEKDKLEKGG